MIRTAVTQFKYNNLCRKKLKIVIKLTPDIHDLYLHGKYFFLVSILWFWLVVAEHEDISSNRMSVEIAVEEYVTRLQCSFHH